MTRRRPFHACYRFLTELQSFLVSKLQVAPKYCILMNCPLIFVRYKSSFVQVISRIFWKSMLVHRFHGCEEHALSLSFLRCVPPGISPLLVIECMACLGCPGFPPPEIFAILGPPSQRFLQSMFRVKNGQCPFRCSSGLGCLGVLVFVVLGSNVWVFKCSGVITFRKIKKVTKERAMAKIFPLWPKKCF